MLRLHRVFAISLLMLVRVAQAQNLAPTYRPLSTNRLLELRKALDALVQDRHQKEQQLQDVRSLLANARSAAQLRSMIDSTAADLRKRAQTALAQAGSNVQTRAAVLQSLASDSLQFRALNDSLTKLPERFPADSMARDSVSKRLARTLSEAAGRLSANRSTADYLSKIISSDSLQGQAFEIQASRLALRTDSTNSRQLLTVDTIALTAAVQGVRTSIAALQGQMDEQLRITSRSWLPVKSSEEAKAFYGRSGVDLISNVLFSGGLDGKAATAATELGSGYVKRVRVSASITVADAKQDTSGSNRSAVERFLVGGGNFSAAAISPLLFLKDKSQDNTLTIQFGARVAADLNGAGGESQVTKPVLETGLDLYGTLINSLAPYYLRGACAGGSSPVVAAIANGHKGFCYAQLTAGVELAGYGRLVFSGAWGPVALKRPIAVTIQPRIGK